jgi:hypothetical protein
VKVSTYENALGSNAPTLSVSRVNEKFIAAECCRYKVVLGYQIPYSTCEVHV